RLHAESAGAHVCAVQIEFKDLFFGQMELEPEREIGLLDLALDRPLVAEEDVLRQLLRDRRPPLHDAGGPGVDGERTKGADNVDAEVTEEAPILGRKQGL